MMEQFGIINFPVFLLAGILLNLTPGSDTIYIVTRSLASGTRAGILSALGISTGAVIHTIGAACGLSVILMHSATAFLLVKYIGAGYLIYLGIRALMTSTALPVPQGGKNRRTDYRGMYLSGVLTNVLNPKVALFFLAFLPQFVIPSHSHTAISFLILGATFITTGTIWCLCLAVFASLLTGKILQKRWYSSLLQKISGGVFIGLGVHLALSKR
ncbi:MAG: LysE family translocator [Desulfopila sp.]|jgi:threonine/homoserine/homoserine lactone efflux protein|nr:LysE family translocator [Desulfopila sp.]